MTDFISLEQFIPAVSPRFMPPKHLRPLTDLLQRVARGEPIRAVVSVPPRHSKTETLLHDIAWLLLQRPELQIAYASYAARISEKKSRRARELARRAGVLLASDSKSRQDWRTTEEEGGCWATSVDGQITGEGFDFVILDDLIKGRASAESAAVRERSCSWLISDVLTRVEPGGSVILSMARWHPSDPAGAMIAAGWEHVNLTALDEHDQPSWPERWPAHELLKLREAMGGPDGYEWQSLYMGEPRGRGAPVFGDVNFYDALPNLNAELASISIGLDFAYSTRTSADWSVAVLMARVGDLFFVLDVVRVQEEPRNFRGRVQLLHEMHPRSTAIAYAAATEQGGIEFLRDGGIPIDGRTAKIDKFSRAIPVAAAWNTGKILLPRDAPWRDAFVSEVCGFTGVKDRHDDQVDALAAAFDGLAGFGGPVFSEGMLAAILGAPQRAAPVEDLFGRLELEGAEALDAEPNLFTHFAPDQRGF